MYSFYKQKTTSLVVFPRQFSLNNIPIFAQMVQDNFAENTIINRFF